MPTDTQVVEIRTASPGQKGVSLQLERTVSWVEPVRGTRAQGSWQPQAGWWPSGLESRCLGWTMNPWDFIALSEAAGGHLSGFGEGPGRGASGGRLYLF